MENNYPRKIRRDNKRPAPSSFLDSENSTVYDPKNIIWSCKNLIVTCGEKGAMYFSKGSCIPKMYDTLPVPENIKDVCGAGDTFLAGLVVQYIEGKNISSSIEYANKCSRKVVKKFGVSVP